MGKRKRDIFTVSESVSNWFEAHTATVTEIERGEGVVNRPNSDSGDAAQANMYAQLAGWGANELNMIPRNHVATITGSGLVPVANHTRVVTTQLGVSPLGIDRADVDRYRAAAQATTEADGYPDGELPHGMGEVYLEENPTSATFWQLLRDAGYYTWYVGRGTTDTRRVLRLIY